jgi:hypothetical protein
MHRYGSKPEPQERLLDEEVRGEDGSGHPALDPTNPLLHTGLVE